MFKWYLYSNELKIWFLGIILWIEGWTICHAYDPSFCEILDDVYQKYHVYEEDFCDTLKDQIQLIKMNKGDNLTFLDLREGGIDPDYLDLMALEYCKKHKDAYIAVIWPTVSYSSEEAIYNILSKHMRILYSKKFSFVEQGGKRFFGSIDEKVPRLEKNFPTYFPKGMKLYPMMCFVLQCDDSDKVTIAKREVRHFLNISPNSIHINDTHGQCIDIAYQILNDNSIHFLNQYAQKKLPQFRTLIKGYKRFLQEENIDEEDVCLEDDAVLAAYGLRDVNDNLSFIGLKSSQDKENKMFIKNNREWQRLGITLEDMIYNPKNYFYFHNVKFVVPSRFLLFKNKRGKKSDLKDAFLIEGSL